MYLIFDTETTGLPKRWDAPITDVNNWPRCVQIAWQLHDEMGNSLNIRIIWLSQKGLIFHTMLRESWNFNRIAAAEGIALSEVLGKIQQYVV